MKTIVSNVPLKSICLSFSLLCFCAAESWGAGTARSQPASNRRASQQAKPAASSPNQAAVTDPYAPSGPMADPGRRMAAGGIVKTEGLGDGSPKSMENPRQAALDDATRRNAKSEMGTRSPLAVDLWSSRISAPDPRDDAETSLALKRLIRQVQSMTLNDKSSAQTPAPPAEPDPAAKPPAPTAANTERVDPAQPEAIATTASETTQALPSKAQKILEDLRRNPSRVQDPLEAAELLFLSGRPTDAVPFYEEALRRTRAGDAASGGDRAWILFQLGNCLRETDTAKAQDAYTKLIAEYPGSPWTEMARAGGRLLTWYQSARPDQLTAPRKP